MRRLNPFFLFLLLFFSSRGYSQVYSLNNGFANGGSVSTCSGTFYDTYPFLNYQANEDYSVTFCSANVGKVMQVVFSSLNIAGGDTLFVFDGNSMASPVLHTITNTSTSFFYATPSATNVTGCLTFRFVSDGVNESNGWTAQIKCIYPCSQRIVASMKTTPVADLNGYTNICFGDTVKFQVSTLFPDNNTIYHQSDTSTMFQWKFGDGTGINGKNLKNVKHYYGKTGGYRAQLSIIDTNGCEAGSLLQMPVRTSLKPIFNITAPPTLCLFDTLFASPHSATGSPTVTQQQASFSSLPISGDSVFLPDNPPQCFTSSIIIDRFAPGQTLNSLNDLKGIFMTLEHSYVGDLNISIEAPNGTKVFLKSTTGGTSGDGTFLGEPVDESLNGGSTNPALLNIPGKGYEYIFNNSPVHGTMWTETDTYTYSYTDNAGQSVVDHYYLPPGSYQSEQSLLPLLGTPINGKWTLQVCDNQNYDNGFLFNWRLGFNPAIFPNPEIYSVPIVSETWMPAVGLLNISNTIATIAPPTDGTFNYTYRVLDSFGCIYDTVIKIVSLPIPGKPNLGSDISICSNQNAVLSVFNVVPGITYGWSTSEMGVSAIRVNQPGTYWVAAIGANGCSNKDSINIFALQPYTVTLGNDTMYCASKPILLTPTATGSVLSWLWSTGDTTQNYLVKDTGVYWVEGKGTTGCAVRDSIHLEHNPINLFELPGDTSICDGTSYTFYINPPAGTSVTWKDGATNLSRRVSGADKLWLTSEYLGCQHLTKEMVITVRSLPIIHLGTDTILCSGYDMTLNAAFPGATFLWSTGSTDSAIVINGKGLYTVLAELDGCYFADTLRVQEKICACNIKMPSAFSPNGDGINDVYRPTTICFPRNYHLTFFNRYGQPVFESKNYKQLWDGRRNGQMLPPAVYYYILTFFNEDRMKEERVSGSVMLLR